jgi:pyrimidine operon attenuation protein / uracil phosphoribosyltransferase
MERLMDQDKIRQTISQLADKLLADSTLQPTAENPIALVGIRSRGELIAQRLAHEISLRTKHSALSTSTPIDVGALDITMYRDDLARARNGGVGGGRALTIPQGTDMNFRLDDRPVILCDDVLFTGRSIRAALDALVDFGRPRIIRLAVLIDRGRREFPIAADYTGLALAPPPLPNQKIVVHLTPTDPEDAVYLT